MYGARWGTNILVADAGVRGLVVVNRCRGYRVDDEGLLLAEWGVLLHELARWTVQEGWAGLEGLWHPGNPGGAVVGNAGAYGGMVAERLAWARIWRPTGCEERVEVQDLAYGYRTSALKRETDKPQRPWCSRRRYGWSGGPAGSWPLVPRTWPSSGGSGTLGDAARECVQTYAPVSGWLSHRASRAQGQAHRWGRGEAWRTF